MKLIPLSTQGYKHKNKYFVQVDDEDYEWLIQWSWSVEKKKNGDVYASRYIKEENKSRRIHQDIMGEMPGKIVDHIDRNTLNCQRLNLRFATKSQNAVNISSRKNSRSKYLGVSIYTQGNNLRWRARISKGKKSITIGYYKTEEEAALQYNRVALEWYREFANLNIIGDSPALQTSERQ